MIKVDRRILKTKEAINKAFIQLLSEKSFDSITINEIASRANINRGTLYLHFDDKYDLMEKIIANHLKTLTDACISKKDWKNTTDLRNSLLHMIEYLEENYLFYSIMLKNGNGHCFRERLLQVIIEGMNEIYIEGINSKIDKEMSTQFIAHAIVGTIEWWIKNKMPLSPIELSRDMWFLIENNL